VTLRYRRHADLRLTALDDEGVALHLGERKYFTVNATGAALLDALATPQTLAQLVDRLCTEFAVEPPEATRTCEEFLARCLTSKLVVADDT
jgi:hypothetical protein